MRSRWIAGPRAAPVAVLLGALLVVGVVSLPVRAWGSRWLERRGLVGGSSEALYSLVGGWGRPVSLLWVVATLLLLLVLGTPGASIGRAVALTAAAAVVLIRAAAYLHDPTGTQPGRWWTDVGMLPAAFAVAAAVHLMIAKAIAPHDRNFLRDHEPGGGLDSLDRRADAVLLAMLPLVALTRPHPSPDVRFGWLPFGEPPPLPAAAAGVVGAALVWVMFDRSTSPRFALVLGLAAAGALVVDVLAVHTAAAHDGLSPLVWQLLTEARGFAAPVVVLLTAALARPGADATTRRPGSEAARRRRWRSS